MADAQERVPPVAASASDRLASLLPADGAGGSRQRQPFHVDSSFTGVPGEKYGFSSAKTLASANRKS